MKVQIISRETIKPSSPAPTHLKIYKLSLLDQLIPAPYVPIVLYYPNYDGASGVQVLERVESLKQSLSNTLNRFYPLAGTIKDDLSIECNDDGVYFAVGEVNCQLSDFVDEPDLNLIHQFLPCEQSFSESSAGARVTNVQASVFECGGISIGLCISHKILDGSALNTFLKAWAAVAAHTTKKVVYPNFVAPSLFPTNNELWLRDTSMVMWGSLFKKGTCVTKRFVFDAVAIATLKSDSCSNKSNNHPTRVEVVSAFLWKCGMAAAESKCGIKRPSLLTHVVNLRNKMAPSLCDNSIGNLIWIASSKCTKRNDHNDDLVSKVRKGISQVDGDYVKKLKGDERSAVMCKSLKEIGEFGSREDVDFFGFTSWCKFGFYQADFGWGKPVWVSGVGNSGASIFMNLIVLMDTRCGEGIEAWVTLDEQEMDLLERDSELLKLASLDPSPLKIGSHACGLNSPRC